MVARVRREKQSDLDRRMGVDGGRLSADIGIHRWFCVFIKCALELEGNSYEMHGKTHKIKFSKTHKWWKLIDLKSFPKTPKFIRLDNKLLASQQRKLFDDYFYPKYRNLFQNKTTIFGSARKVPDDFLTMNVPPNYPMRKLMSDIKKHYKDKEIAMVRKGKKSKEFHSGKGEADIVLRDGSELMLKRIFNVLSIDQSNSDLDNLHKHFHVQNRMYGVKIPKIESIGSQEIEHNPIGSKTTKTTRSNYDDSIVRTLQRDRRKAKILLVNLCNGVFPVFNKVL